MKYAHCFICQECGYAIALSSGVILECDICGAFGAFRRCTHEEYHNAETNDGNLKEGGGH
jgi:predicted ATP-dependent serine protease